MLPGYVVDGGACNDELNVRLLPNNPYVNRRVRREVEAGGTVQMSGSRRVSGQRSIEQ